MQLKKSMFLDEWCPTPEEIVVWTDSQDDLLKCQNGEWLAFALGALAEQDGLNSPAHKALVKLAIFLTLLSVDVNNWWELVPIDVACRWLKGEQVTCQEVSDSAALLAKSSALMWLIVDLHRARHMIFSIARMSKLEQRELLQLMRIALVVIV